MASLPVVFRFDRAQVKRFETPKAWVAALGSTGRFYRSPQGGIWFLLSRQPCEIMAIGREPELRGIVEAGDIIKIECPRHPFTDDDFKYLWHSANDFRHKLPSAVQNGIDPVRR